MEWLNLYCFVGFFFITFVFYSLFHQQVCFFLYKESILDKNYKIFIRIYLSFISCAYFILKCDVFFFTWIVKIHGIKICWIFIPISLYCWTSNIVSLFKSNKIVAFKQLFKTLTVKVTWTVVCIDAYWGVKDILNLDSWMKIFTPQKWTHRKRCFSRKKSHDFWKEKSWL